MYRQLILASLALIVLSVPARADNVITSGTITLTPTRPITQMSFSGSGFSVAAFGDGFGGSGFVPCMFGCSAGSSLTLSASTGFWGFSDVSGSMIINGVTFTFVNQPVPTLPQVVGSGIISFAGGSVDIPFSDDPLVTLSAPFSITSGFLAGNAINGSVALDLSGSGIGTLTLSNLGNGQYVATGLTYTFQPVPEPATLILLASGLTGIAVRYRKRKNS